MVYYYHKLVNQDNIETIVKNVRPENEDVLLCKKELVESMMNF